MSIYSFVSTSRRQDIHDLLEATLASVRQRRYSIGVGKVDVCTCLYKEPDDLSMPRSTVSENNRFQERGPAQVVNVINFDICFQQLLDDLNVTTISGADKPCTVVAIL